MASIPTFPSIDLSKLDLSKLDLSKLDLSRFEVAGVDTDKVLGLVRDAAYVVIGFGVLSVQQVQVRRRELRATLEQRAARLGIAKDQLDDVISQIETRLGELDQRLEGIETKLDEAVESAIDAMGERLPEQAGALLGQAHEAAKAARKQVRGLLVSAA
ncbi:MAG: hypothetical protein F2534_05085 [Actinobacteria bacterium]|jgi:hypothetical protein|uniref:Unannotated protein n=1 Tax=freshwater metagenome TaxID=449393 RepID=A0A6J6CDZ5_9ZZZZ|nr:hypothetical protein [Actinomycetota bacterium]